MKKYIVDLTEDERASSQALIRRGKTPARKLTRARTLLHAARGSTDAEIVTALGVGQATAERTRRRFVEEGLGAMNERPRPGARPCLSEKAEARLVAEACGRAPEGRRRWAMRLPAGRAVELGLADSCSHEAARRVLKKSGSSRGRRSSGVSLRSLRSTSPVWRTCSTSTPSLTTNAAPVVNSDGESRRLVSETRTPIPAQPGRVERFDYEYRRGGVADLFAFREARAGRRRIAVTERHTKQEFAAQMRWLVDEGYPQAGRIRVVLDDLGTHRPASPYERYAPEEARRILRKLEFHHTPEHGSWLNKVEIELSVLERQRLSRRIPDTATLQREVAAYEARRNEAGATITWDFTVDDARRKLKRVYPSTPV